MIIFQTQKNRKPKITAMKTFYLVLILLSLFACKKEETEDPYQKDSGAFTDSRDGKTYQWVKIGTQIWMAENLAYLPKVSPPSKKSETEAYYYVYGYESTILDAALKSDNYDKYGALYNYPAALSASPEGWHLPTDADWDQLAQYVSDQNGGYTKQDDDWFGVGKHLRTITGWRSGLSTTVGIDTYGFAALPGGYRYPDGSFLNEGGSGYWWASNVMNTSDSWSRRMSSSDNQFFRVYFGKDCCLSIRCIKD